MTEAPLPPRAAAVQAVLEQAGHPGRVRTFPDSTRTAAEAAAAIGCSVAQIVKSLVFRLPDGAPLLVLASGANRVDPARLAAALDGRRPERADADFVRRTTGYAIGGVAPVGHALPVEVVIDRDLLALDPLWAAAGTPHAVFPLSPADLLRLTGGRVAEIAA